MSKHILKLYTAETEYLEMAISKKEFQTYSDSGVPEDAIEKLEDHTLYCAPFFDDRCTLLLDDKEIAKANPVLQKLYDSALDSLPDADTVSKPSKKHALISERYVKRAWYGTEIEGKFDSKKLSLKINLLPGKDVAEDFVSYRLAYDGVELQFEDNFGASSSEMYLRDPEGNLIEAQLESDEDDDEGSAWLGSEEDALSEIIAAGRDDWNTDDLVESYGKETAIVKIQSNPESREGFTKFWRFAKNKKKFFYDTCRKWPVTLVAVDDPESLQDLKSYSEANGLDVYSCSLLPDSMVAAKNFDEEDLARYRDNTDPRFQEFASPQLSALELKEMEQIYPGIKAAAQCIDWVACSDDTPEKERDTLKKFEEKFPDDCFGRMANDTWSPTCSMVKITGPISYSSVTAQVIELRTQQPELLPVAITEEEFNEIRKNGVPEDIERELDWAPGMRIDRRSLNPMVFNAGLKLYVNGKECPEFSNYSKEHIEPLFKKGDQSFDGTHALFVQAPEHKRKAYFTLKAYEPFDISKLSTAVDYVVANPEGVDQIRTIKLCYAGVPFVLDVFHTSPERKANTLVNLVSGESRSL